MNWMPLYVALGVWVIVVFIANRAANRRAEEARLTMDEANKQTEKYLEMQKENNRLLEELNAVLSNKK